MQIGLYKNNMMLGQNGRDIMTDNVGDYETLKQDIAIPKKVVTEHSEKLQKIS